MKFLLDIPVAPRIATFLSELGHDAAYASDLGLSQAPDAKIAERAAAEGRIVVTMDLDFAALLALTHETSPSLILFRLRNAQPSRIESILRDGLSWLEEALASGAIVIIDDSGTRIRRLPIPD